MAKQNNSSIFANITLESCFDDESKLRLENARKMQMGENSVMQVLTPRVQEELVKLTRLYKSNKGILILFLEDSIMFLFNESIMEKPNTSFVNGSFTVDRRDVDAINDRIKTMANIANKISIYLD